MTDPRPDERDADERDVDDRSVDERSADERRAAVRRARRRRMWRRRLISLAVLVGLLVTSASVGLAVVYAKLDGNLTSEDVRSRLGQRPGNPWGKDGPLDILVLGSDTREGANAGYGRNITGARSDTAILLHLSGDRKRAVAVSIPRDTMVPIPACTRADGTSTEPAFDMFNSAFQRAGSACTIRTVESLTGVFVHHHVVIDFTGFKRMVDALGTVPVCLPHAVDDPKSKLHLPAGPHELDGEQALAYVRTRYGLGGGSDTSRIGRQQAFLSAMLQKATSTGTLTNPTRLYRFLDAATQSVTTDPDLASLDALRELAQEVRGIGLDRIRFVTAPTEPYPPDHNRLQLTPAAEELWRLLRTDAPLPGKEGGETSSPSPAPATGLRVAPAQVRVRVLNGSGVAGAAARAAEDLRRLGFQVVGVANASAPVEATTVRNDPAYDDSARTLAAAVPGAGTEVTAGKGAVLDLVVGADYSGARPVEVPTPSPSPSALGGRTADQDVCS